MQEQLPRYQFSLIFESSYMKKIIQISLCISFLSFGMSIADQKTPSVSFDSKITIRAKNGKTRIYRDKCLVHLSYKSCFVKYKWPVRSKIFIRRY